MKKLLLGLIVSLLSASAVMAQSFKYNNEETVRNAYTLYTSWNRYSPLTTYNEDQQLVRDYILKNLCIPLYMSFPENGSVKYCWYDTKMMFGEKVRTSESPSRIEEGTYVNGRLSMYKASDGYIYKFNWVNMSGMVLLESIVKYGVDGSEKMRHSGQIYKYSWEKAKTISAISPKAQSISIYNAYITSVLRKSDGVLRLFGYDFYGGGLRQKYVDGRYYSRKWNVSKKEEVVFRIMPDGRFAHDKSEEINLYDFNDSVRCECYVY